MLSSLKSKDVRDWSAGIWGDREYSSGYSVSVVSDPQFISTANLIHASTGNNTVSPLNVAMLPWFLNQN